MFVNDLPLPVMNGLFTTREKMHNLNFQNIYLPNKRTVRLKIETVTYRGP